MEEEPLSETSSMQEGEDIHKRHMEEYLHREISLGNALRIIDQETRNAKKIFDRMTKLRPMIINHLQKEKQRALSKKQRGGLNLGTIRQGNVDESEQIQKRFKEDLKTQIEKNHDIVKANHELLLRLPDFDHTLIIDRATSSTDIEGKGVNELKDYLKNIIKKNMTLKNIVKNNTKKPLEVSCKGEK